MKKVRVVVDTFRCKWCEACVAEMPEVFYYDALTGKAAAVGDEMELSRALETVLAICPTSCIDIEEV